jgi:hypothetical protein
MPTKFHKNSPEGRSAKLAERGRLPDGSEHATIWNAERQEWTGTLSVPGFPVFHAKANGVFRLLSNLDDCYRNYLASKKGEA